jgi:UDP-N-acetylmuramoylalanine--D-glutamate ligase|tara:strand:- start:12573 stop:13913 length:1341 start_codon:yes stop_codon:yes gene_type:complete
VKTETQEKLSVIVGLGETGMSCARYFARNGIPFAVQDSNVAPAKAAELRDIAPQALLSVLNSEALCNAGMIVLSPGVPLATREIQAAQTAGVPITGDINMFLHLVDQPIVAITGSNGKSTVTALVGEILTNGGLAVGVGGNIGTPCLDLLDKRFEVFVLELSSYQLEVVEAAGCKVAAVLNLSPDHLDRYESVDAYYSAKARVYQGAQVAIVNRQVEFEFKIEGGTKIISFGEDAPVNAEDYGLRVIDGRTLLMRGQEVLLALDQMQLKGRHNAMNALAALAICDQFSIDPVAKINTVQTFSGLPHRCEALGVFGGAEFINDSKATNPGATSAAVQGLAQSDRPMLLILGGVSKGADFTSLQAVVSEHVAKVFLYGADADAIKTALAGFVTCAEFGSLAAVVDAIAAEVTPGSLVLFAPACASFDQFDNFEHRGREFKKLVKEAFL